MRTATSVSIIVPCYNEASTIGDLLEGVYHQTYPLSELEVLVVDGGSTDGTQRVVGEFAREHPDLDLRLVPNPDRIIPAALNRGVAAARAEVIVRLDAHAKPAPDYVECCLEVLEQTGAANAGGLWQIEPGGEGWQARAIAAAASHPLGAGDARYRVDGEAGPVETVPFGAFRRDWLERVGPFNEDLLTNEDYEYNVRLREAGGTIWFDPSIRSTYYARSSLVKLARQYWRYGFWKARMLRRRPDSLRWRQALPPTFVLGVAALLFAGFPWPPAWTLLLAGLVVYGLILLLAGGRVALTRGDVPLLLGVPLALTVMHLAWGGGFWAGLLNLSRASGARDGRAAEPPTAPS